jgi:DNA-binding SARP family transcriptional activator/tetratricopeptide (TPR) repeat protein
MEVRVLGPVEVRVRDRVVDIGAIQQRIVLAALAVDAGRPVTISALIDRVWDEAPPAGARQAVYAYVSRLRRLLGRDAAPGGRPMGGDVQVLRRADGYVLDLDAELVDLHRFRRLVSAARASGPSDVEQTKLLREALDIWSGTPLAGLPGAWAARVRAGWQQERLDVAVRWAGIELGLGRAAEVIGPVRELLREHPVAEPLVEVLMRALAATGREAEALDYYAALRARLAEELGVEPGSQLRAVHQAVLRDELGTPAPPPVAAPAAAVTPVPAQLPAEVTAFTGREQELAALDLLLAERSDGGPGGTGLVISAISGAGGVGKTTLALRWAHRVRSQFPDGQLYANLRGFDCKQPLAPGEVLARFLHALGVKGSEIPLDEDDRAARYRTAIAGRRMLVVLDNAASTEQVSPLLPGTASCVVVVTSRDSLVGLVVGHGASRLELDRMPMTDAVALLQRLIGARVAAEPDAAEALAEQCVRLPLALRVAADLASTGAASTLAELVTELADHRRRLDLLDAGGDSRAAVRAVLSSSYEHLPAGAARAFRLAGLHPGPDLDVYALAALLGTGLAEAQQQLSVLVRAHLLEPTSPGRFAMHDLLRAYATELAYAHDAGDDQHAAYTRLFDHYLATAAAAADLLFPADVHHRPRIPAPATPRPALTDLPAASAWLDNERLVLAAVCAYTAAYGWHTHAIRLSHTLYRYHENCGHYTDMLVAHTHALRAARHAGDRAAEAHALSSVGAAVARLHGYRQAREHLEAALAIFRELGDRYGQTRALGNLGNICRRLGEYEVAADLYRQALGVSRDLGDRVAEAYALTALGLIESLWGRLEAAVQHLRQALELYRETGHRTGEGHALCSLGNMYGRLGRYEPAAAHHHQALVLFRQLGNRSGEAETLTGLGDVSIRLRRYDAAIDNFQQALALHHASGGRHGQTRTLNGLGEARCMAGAHREAVADHTAALDLAGQTGEREEQARAHTGLAYAYHALAEPDLAREHWDQALALYTDLCSPHADDIRAMLGLPPLPEQAIPQRSRRHAGKVTRRRPAVHTG